MRKLLAATLFAVLVVPGALASHMSEYRYDAVQHDAQGTVPEPDGLSTTVLGPSLTNCVLELPRQGSFGGRCGDDAAGPTGLGTTLAPGCTGDDGDGNPIRREDGRCGLWTIGVGSAPTGGALSTGGGVVPAPLSEPGMGAAQAPGRHRGPVRFLDGRITWTVPQLPAGPSMSVDVARVLREVGVVDGTVLPGEGLAWTWYGQWTDLNGNGVVDHFSPGTAGAGQSNEFAWLGGCAISRDASRNPQAILDNLCIEDPNRNLVPPGTACADPASTSTCAGTSMAAWLFPGNHHADANAAGHFVDMPGLQVVQWVVRLGNCSAPPTCDDFDRDYAGDPLLGTQAELTADIIFSDRTGDTGNAGQDDTDRGWLGGVGYASNFYGDDGFLVTEAQVYGVNCRGGAAPWRYDLLAAPGEPGGCSFLDVDRQSSLNGEAEAALVGDPQHPDGGLKGIVRGAWLLIRDGSDTGPLLRFLDSLNSSELYAARQGPLLGEADDSLLDRGWSREPNAPSVVVAGKTIDERFPGVSYRACEALPVGDARNPTEDPDPASLEAQHRGWCNAGPGVPAYEAYRVAPRGFVDAHPVRDVLYLRPLTLLSPPCTACVATDLVSIGQDPEPGVAPPGQQPPEDHRRTLGPGQYYVAGKVGLWHDVSEDRDESLFPDGPGTTVVNYPADGWVGMAARATGQWEYRGYLPRICTTEKDDAFDMGLHAAAECNPYLDGNAQDPQDYAVETEGEWDGECEDTHLGQVFLTPLDGGLDTQIIVWRHHRTGIGPVPSVPEFEAYGPGPVEPLAIDLLCVPGDAAGRFESADYLIWPEGNHADDVATWIDATVALPGGTGSDILRDLDIYLDWEPGP
jgi:hypothetical protein